MTYHPGCGSGEADRKLGQSNAKTNAIIHVLG